MIYFVLAGMILWLVIFFGYASITDGEFAAAIATVMVGLPPLIGYLACLGMTSL